MGQSQDKLRVAVAGGHRMTHRTPGSHNFATAFHAVPETDVVAVFDLGAETRTEFADCWREVWGEIPTYHDYGADAWRNPTGPTVSLPHAKRCTQIRLS